jgi:hypothetical protein
MLGELSEAKAATKAPIGPSPLRLTTVNDPQNVQATYSGRGGGPATVPYVYAQYDIGSKTFLNPIDVIPTQPSGAYTLEPTLFAFNIKTSDQEQFKRLQNQVQLGFNATAPITGSDKLTWLFTSAIDVFLQKAADEPKALTTFLKDNGVPLQSSPKITVSKGLVNLQVTAFGQRKEGFWRKFLDTMAAVVKSPIVGTALKGFGIPSLAGDALTFVDHAVDVFANEEKLVPLWQTGSLEFAIHKGAADNAIFKMNPGLWVTVDSEYAKATNFLAGHTLDLSYQSFKLMDSGKKLVDTNYLVTKIAMTS